MRKLWGLIVALVLAMSLMVGAAPASAQTPFWIVFGGNENMGDGQGGGWFKNELVRLGWATPDRVFQVHYPAAVERMEQSTQEAMPAGIAAYNEFCGGNACIIAGFSQGTDPAIELGRRVGHPGELTFLFGGPQPATGIWHHYAPNHPFIEPFIQRFGFPTNRIPVPGTKHFYHTEDPYANMAPQCFNWGAVFSMYVHIVLAPGVGDVWVGPDGVENHEQMGANPVVASGRTGQAIGCPPGGWYTG